MANATVLNTDSRNVLKAQENRIATELIRNNPFEGLIGPGDNNVIKTLTDLTKQRGDTIRVYFGGKLLDDGQDGDDTVEGNEEDIRDFYMDIRVGQKRKGIRLNGRLTEQRSQVPLRVRAGQLLPGFASDITMEYTTYYLSGARGVRPAGGGIITPVTFSGFAGNALTAPDANHWLIADQTGAPAIAQLTQTGIMKTSVIEQIRKKQRLLVNNGPMMEPIKYGGKTVQGIMYLCPEQLYDLRQDPGWKDDQRFANSIGDDNPIFSGAEGMYAGYVIKELSCGVLFNNYGAAGTLPAARGFVVGAKALGLAYGDTGTENANNKWFYREKEFDYYNKAGFATGSMFGMQKLRWNGQDYGVFTFDTAYSA